LTVQYRNRFGQVNRRLPYWRSRMVSPILTLSHLGTSPNIVRYCTINCIITFLLYIQLFKEDATYKLHFVLIVLPCKQQNVTYIICTCH